MRTSLNTNTKNRNIKWYIRENTSVLYSVHTYEQHACTYKFVYHFFCVYFVSATNKCDKWKTVFTPYLSSHGMLNMQNLLCCCIMHTRCVCTIIYCGQARHLMHVYCNRFSGVLAVLGHIKNLPTISIYTSEYGFLSHLHLVGLSGGNIPKLFGQRINFLYKLNILMHTHTETIQDFCVILHILYYTK